jgi:hypothetical protein
MKKIGLALVFLLFKSYQLEPLAVAKGTLYFDEVKLTNKG